MTTHLDEERLAQWVIDGETPDDAAADHLRLCDHCRESLKELQAVAGHIGDLPRLDTPPADVWARIGTELAFDASSTQAPPPDAPTTTPNQNNSTAHTQPEPPSPSSPVAEFRRARRPIGRTALAIAACVAGVVGIGAGALGAVLVTSDDSDRPTSEAVARLEPLAGKSGDGNADLLRGANGIELKVTATGLAAKPGFYEVWLINEDGKRMISLGVLNPSTGGTFQIPSDLTGQGYRIVDISLEPDDGNPEHSHDSIIRGTLPS